MDQPIGGSSSMLGGTTSRHAVRSGSVVTPYLSNVSAMASRQRSCAPAERAKPNP
jgi:hypothetical protein